MNENADFIKKIWEERKKYENTNAPKDILFLDSDEDSDEIFYDSEQLDEIHNKHRRVIRALSEWLYTVLYFGEQGSGCVKLTRRQVRYSASLILDAVGKAMLDLMEIGIEPYVDWSMRDVIESIKKKEARNA